MWIIIVPGTACTKNEYIINIHQAILTENPIRVFILFVLQSVTWRNLFQNAQNLHGSFTCAVSSFVVVHRLNHSTFDDVKSMLKSIKLYAPLYIYIETVDEWRAIKSPAWIVRQDQSDQCASVTWSMETLLRTASLQWRPRTRSHQQNIYKYRSSIRKKIPNGEDVSSNFIYVVML